jgi:hypothetical protein
MVTTSKPEVPVDSPTSFWGLVISHTLSTHTLLEGLPALMSKVARVDVRVGCSTPEAMAA